jgi:hypothetical protein
LVILVDESLMKIAQDALLYLGRHDLKKGRTAPRLPLFAIGVDSRLDYFPGIRRFDDLAFLGAWPLSSEKRSRDPLPQVIVISHIAMRAQV